MVVTGGVRSSAPRVVLRFEGLVRDSGLKPLKSGFWIEERTEFNPGAMQIALRKVRP
jgi:hypothetical protein